VASAGAGVAGIYPGSLQRVGLRSGEVLVDIGTGRGELLAVAVEAGAARAIGVEYSAAAVELARRTIDAHGVADRAEVLLADARSIPLDDGLADVVTLLDVVEHLAPAELAGSLAEAHRLLRPGGRLLIHTFPTSTIRKVYRLQRLAVPGRRRRWPVDPRHPLEVSMHVNEQTARRLGRAVRAAGFEATPELGEWVWTDYVPASDERAKRLYHRLAKLPLTRRFGVSNLWCLGTKPSR
jgi:ubiquinone/menaquinone biosynthesis C-methylase UbiE